MEERMSLIYWLSKFSQEAILLELFLIACVATAYFGYLLTLRRKYGAAKKNIPDHVVRAFLVELLSHTEGFKNQLFGEDFKIPKNHNSTFAGISAELANSMPASATTSAAGGADPAELLALKAALATAIGKQEQLNKSVGTLANEKAALEAKLAAAAAAGGAPAAAGPGDKELADKIAKLESKLAEYEVIEDDLANLKKYQQENKQLRAQLDAKGGAAAPAAAASAPAAQATPAAPAAEPVAAAAPEPIATAEPIAVEVPPAAVAAAAAPSPITAAEDSVNANKAAENFEGLVDKVEESLAEPVAALPEGASATDPAALAELATSAPVSDTPAPAAAKPATDAPSKTEKSDADLLNEFERMLSS
jgi:hypothetical protein